MISFVQDEHLRGAMQNLQAHAQDIGQENIDREHRRMHDVRNPRRTKAMGERHVIDKMSVFETTDPSRTPMHQQARQQFHEQRDTGLAAHRHMSQRTRDLMAGWKSLPPTRHALEQRGVPATAPQPGRGLELQPMSPHHPPPGKKRPATTGRAALRQLMVRPEPTEEKTMREEIRL